MKAQNSGSNAKPWVLGGNYCWGESAYKFERKSRLALLTTTQRRYPQIIERKGPELLLVAKLATIDCP